MLSKSDTPFVHHTLCQRNVFEPIRIASTKAVESMESQSNRASGIGIADHELPLCATGRVGYFWETFKVVHLWKFTRDPGMMQRRRLKGSR